MDMDLSIPDTILRESTESDCHTVARAAENPALHAMQHAFGANEEPIIVVADGACLGALSAERGPRMDTGAYESICEAVPIIVCTVSARPSVPPCPATTLMLTAVSETHVDPVAVELPTRSDIV